MIFPESEALADHNVLHPGHSSTLVHKSRKPQVGDVRVKPFHGPCSAYSQTIPTKPLQSLQITPLQSQATLAPELLAIVPLAHFRHLSSKDMPRASFSVAQRKIPKSCCACV